MKLKDRNRYPFVMLLTIVFSFGIMSASKWVKMGTHPVFLTCDSGDTILNCDHLLFSSPVFVYAESSPEFLQAF